jgi:hypothetical protein
MKKKVYILEPEKTKERGLRENYRWLKETDFTEAETRALLEKTGIVWVKKKRK